MKEKIKIIHFITHLPVGGAQDNTLFTLELLDKKKYEIFLACNFSGELVSRAKKIEGINLINIVDLQREVNIIKDIKALFKIYFLLRREKFNIVHTHSSKAGLIARIASKINKVPLIIHTVHGFPFNDFMSKTKRNFYIYLEKKMAQFSDALITVSNLNKQKIIDLKICNKEKIFNIYSGIDLEIFKSRNDNSFRKSLNINKESILIGSVGRLSLQKDPLTMIKAITIVKKNIQNVHLVLVGDGDMKKELIEEIEKHKIQNYVHLVGNIMDIWNVYPSLDLFIMSSIYEGLGRSITEALCCKIPVVCTNVEGVPEIVRNNITGLLVEPRDHLKLANAIISSLNNIDKSKKMAENGSEFVNENFDVKKMVADIDDLYEKLID